MLARQGAILFSVIKSRVIPYPRYEDVVFDGFSSINRIRKVFHFFFIDKIPDRV